MELWDAYLEDETKTDDILVRGEPIPAGLHHLVCEILVRHADGDFLLMQRDINKQSYPGWYEASAGGSALRSEDAPAAAKRELFEETGLQGTFSLLAHLTEGDCIFYAYLCTVNCPKDSIVLQNGETASYKWLDREAFLAFADSAEMIPFQRRHFEAYLQTL